MKVIELLKIDHIVLNILHENCINLGDVRYIGLYDDFMHIIGHGGKITYAVSVLSEKYKISERKVYYLLKKFSVDCNIGAV